jgi:4-hydroxy-tetrahydrodipicolinate reductase
VTHVRIAVAGACGNMGRAVREAIANDVRFTISAGIVREHENTNNRKERGLDGPEVPLMTDVRDLRGAADAVVDFTTPEGTVEIATACGEIGLPLVSGTTGLRSDQFNRLDQIARSIPIVWAANMSVGITAIRTVLADLARALNGYDVEIVERHHRRKVDAPSGTARELGRLIASGAAEGFDSRAVFGRHGAMPRSPSEIGVHAVRAGGDPGSHTVIFGGDGDEVTLSHRAFGRECYARGALEAAAFVAGKSPGLYSMDDVLASRTV